MPRSPLRRVAIGAGLNLAAALVAGCSRPPPASAITEGKTGPQSSLSGAVEGPQATYPVSPDAPPPVPPPPGEGNKVPLQRYIVVDQFGYLPDMQKFGILVDPQVGWNAADGYTPPEQLEVRRWETGEVVFQGRITPWKGGEVDATSGDRGAWFSFTSVREPGLYYVYDPAHEMRSHPFEIGPGVYAPVLKTAARMFYFNRANFAKASPFACLGDRCWEHSADNLGPRQDAMARSIAEPDRADTARDLSGGWWDAGDTTKYVTYSAEAVHQLLTAYAERPEVFTDDFGIPESGNGLPDLIDELLVEFHWLAKMQPDDLQGGGLLKVGNARPPEVDPAQSNLPRYYYPEPCSSATITLAGQFAHGALVFSHFAPLRQYSSELKDRAERAWHHYHDSPKSDACDDGRIAFGDADKSLEWQAQMAVVAATYLFSLTQKQEYDDYVRDNHAVTRPFKDDRWSVYDPSQGDALIYYARLKHADDDTKEAIRKRKLQQSESIEMYRMRSNFDLYRAYMRQDAYELGSNQVRAGYANTNYDLVQYRWVKDPADLVSFTERAAGLLHSFHGVNPMQLTYLTNMYAVGGDACADEMYHAWFRDGDPLWDNARTSKYGPAPGFVTAGPNKDYCQSAPADHACSQSPLRAQPPAKAYVDSNQGWAPDSPYDKTWQLTEPAIYYQAAYLRLLSKFVAGR